MTPRSLSIPRLHNLSELSSPDGGFYPTPLNSEDLGPYHFPGHHRPQAHGFEGQHNHRSHHAHPLGIECHEMKDVLITVQAELNTLSYVTTHFWNYMIFNLDGQIVL